MSSTATRSAFVPSAVHSAAPSGLALMWRAGPGTAVRHRILPRARSTVTTSLRAESVT